MKKKNLKFINVQKKKIKLELKLVQSEDKLHLHCLTLLIGWIFYNVPVACLWSRIINSGMRNSRICSHSLIFLPTLTPLKVNSSGFFRTSYHN